MEVKSTSLVEINPSQAIGLRVFLAFMCLLLASAASYAQVSGTVFRDLNANGVQNNTTSFRETGVQGVTVKAYNTAGVQVGGDKVTDVNGAYSFTGLTLPVRVEFSGLAAGDFPGAQGSGSGTSVQFVSAASTAVNYGINYPSDYCQAVPPLFVPCYVNGDPTGGGTAGSLDALVSVPSTASGTSPSPTKIAPASAVGSVWGMAYHRTSKRVMTAAFLKRHVGLLAAGLGGIYSTNPATQTSSLYVDLENAPYSINLGQSVLGTRTLPASASTSSNDAAAFDGVGKLGLGGLSLSEDEKTLFTINLFEKKLIKMNVGSPLKPSLTAADVTSYTIPDPGCTNGVARPFAVNYYRGKVYVGVICSAETSGTQSNLRAYVYVFDPVANTFNSTPVVNFSLNYPKGKVHTSETPDRWMPWISQFNQLYLGTVGPPPLPRAMQPQPMLTDIDFLDNGDMVLGFTDRAGHQLGYNNRGTTGTALYNGYIGGDILRLSKTGASAWTLESGGQVSGLTGNTTNNQGPGGGEFYSQETFVQNSAAIHEETYMGSSVFIPGQTEIGAIVMDPTGVFTGGFKWFSNTNGTTNRSYEVYSSTSANNQTFGKANGLGGVAPGCDPAPIEIGNRVWLDLDNDGVQDPNETGISGITVTLCLASAPTVAVATATTDANGNYYFSTATGTSTASVRYGLSLSNNTNYILKFPTTNGGKPLSPVNTGGNDLIDSDAGANGQIAFTTGVAGQNNHSFDVGYSNCLKPVAVATPKNQTICAGNPAAAYTTTPSTGVQYRWFGPLTDTTSTLGTAISGATTATFTPSGAQIPASGVRYFAVVVNTTGDLTCSDTAFVSLTVNVKPVVGNATICAPATTATLTLTPAGGVFTALAGNPAAGASVTSAGAVSGLTANGTYQFVYTLNGCSDTATVVRNAKPNAGADKSLACADPVAGTLQTTTTLAGFSPAGGVFTAAGGNPAAATVTGGGSVSGMAVAGTYNFIYTVNGCADTVAVTVQPCAVCTKPNAGADVSICAPATTVSLTGFSPSGGVWTARAGNPATATVTSTGVVSGLTANGTYGFVYSVTLGGQTCSDTVQVIRNVKPVVGDAAICAPATTATLTLTPAGGVFTALAGNPAAGASVTSAGAVSGLTANGTYQFVYTLNGCSDTATVVRNAKPNAGADKSLACADPVAGTLQTTTTLAGFSPAGGVFTAAGGNPAAATVTGGGSVSGMAVAGTYNFIYTVNGCADTVAVTVQPCAVCTKPNAGADVSICAPATTVSLTGFSPSGGVWTARAGNPATATVTSTGVVSGLTANGTYGFVYSVTLGGQTCSDTVQVIRNVKPVVGDAAICAPATTATLTLTPAGGVFTALAGNPAAGASVTSAGAVSGLTANGTYQFVYTLNGCSDTATVVRNAKPNAGADKSLACADPVAGTLQTTTTLAGFSPAGGVFTAAGGNPAAATVTGGGSVSGMAVAGTYNFIYTVNGCADTVAVTVQPCAVCTKPNAGADVSICAPATTVSLTGFSPSGGVWTARAGNPATATVTSTGVVSGLTANGTYGFVYSVTLGGQTCSDTVQVIRNVKPVVGDAAICAPATTATLTLTPAGGVFTALAGNPAAGASVTSAGAVSGLTANGTYQFVYTLNGCSDTATVVRNAKPNAGADTTLACQGVSVPTSYTLSATPAGGVYTQFGPNLATLNGNVASGLTPGNTYNFIYTVNDCADTVVVTTGVCVLGTIGDFVWKDLNDNGQQDANEPGVDNVKVTLHQATAGSPGPAIDSTLTTSGGKYLFDSLVKGEYIVKLDLTTLPDSCLISTKLNTAVDSLDNDFDTAGFSPVIILDPVLGGINKDNPTIDAALYTPKGSLGDFVWKDLNDNGRQDAGEPGVDNVKVVLWSAVGGSPSAKLDSTLTSGNGAYSFTGLLKGNYVVQIDVTTLPDSCVISSKQNQAGVADSLDSDFDPAGLSQVVSIDPTVDSLKNNSTIDAALFTPLGSIGDFVWKDLNDNGQQDAGEPGVNNVKVVLWSAVGGSPSAKLDSTLTSGNGSYSFTGLLKGDYVVQIDVTTLPDSCVISSKQNQAGVPDSLDSDFDPAGLSQVVSIDPTVDSSKNNSTIDAALFTPLGSIGDFVWKDLNDNGQQDAGEPGVNNVKVVLWSAVGGSPSAKLDSTLTSGNGSYSFTGLLKGDYVVQIDVTTLPDSCVISSKQNQAGVPDSLDSDFDPAGLSQVVSIDPTVDSSKNNSTIDAGLFSPKGSIGSIVFKDLNDNGQQDAGEPGVNGVKVILYSAVGGIPSTKLESMSTSGGGFYSFTGLSKGSYVVGIDLGTLPDSCVLSPKQNQAGVPDSLDSDFSPIGFSDPIDLDPVQGGLSQNNPTINAGLISPKGSIGDYVFKDANKNGKQDPEEVGVNGVDVILWTSDINGTPLTPLDTMTTSGVGPDMGKYLFTNLPAGDYVVQFVKSTLPVNCDKFTSRDTTGIAGIDDTNDSDADTTTGITARITLAPVVLGPGSTPQDSLNTNNLTVDAGLLPKIIPDPLFDLTLSKAINKKLAMLGDTITYTITVFNEGEGTVHGIEVTDSLNAGVQFLSGVATIGSYSNATKLWTLDSLEVNNTATLTIKVKVTAQGVWFNQAEITKMTEPDKDSEPSNGTEGEDDIDRECFTVPILVCRGQGQGVQLSVPAQYTGVVWFRQVQGGQPEQVATGNTYVAAETELGSYEYTFTSSSGTCPADGCCPILVVVEDCCPAEVCVPFTVTKRKK